MGLRRARRRGYTGRVVSATESHVRLELEAQYKTVTVRRDQLPVEQGGQPMPRPAPSYAGLPGSQTPGAAARTPLHVTATPMHAWGSQTPLHPSATPLHPGAGAARAPGLLAWMSACERERLCNKPLAGCKPACNCILAMNGMSQPIVSVGLAAAHVHTCASWCHSIHARHVC